MGLLTTIGKNNWQLPHPFKAQSRFLLLTRVSFATPRLLKSATLDVTGDSVFGFKNKKGGTFPEAATRELLDPVSTVFNTVSWVVD